MQHKFQVSRSAMPSRIRVVSRPRGSDPRADEAGAGTGRRASARIVGVIGRLPDRPSQLPDGAACALGLGDDSDTLPVAAT